MGDKRKQLFQISKQESPKYQSLTKSLQKLADAKVVGGINFKELKEWALQRKKGLLP